MKRRSNVENDGLEGKTANNGHHSSLQTFLTKNQRWMQSKLSTEPYVDVGSLFRWRRSTFQECKLGTL